MTPTINADIEDGHGVRLRFRTAVTDDFSVFFDRCGHACFDQGRYWCCVCYRHFVGTPCAVCRERWR